MHWGDAQARCVPTGKTITARLTAVTVTVTVAVTCTVIVTVTIVCARINDHTSRVFE